MKKPFPSPCWLALAVVFALPLRATAEPTIIAPEGPVPIGGFADVEIWDLENPQSLAWDVEPEARVRVSAIWGQPNVPILSIPSNASGKWTIAVAYIEGEKAVIHLIPIVVGEGEPEPDPDDDEDDDDPVPVPGKVKAIILHESQQPLAAFTPTIRSYLNSHSQVLGGLPQWKLWDDDFEEEDLIGLSQDWKDAYQAATSASNGVVPWLYLTNGTSGYSGKLPETETDLLALLKKYGGE